MELNNRQKDLLKRILDKEIKEYEDEILKSNYHPQTMRLIVEQQDLKEILELVSL